MTKKEIGNISYMVFYSKMSEKYKAEAGNASDFEEMDRAIGTAKEFAEHAVRRCEQAGLNPKEVLEEDLNYIAWAEQFLKKEDA